MSGRGVRTRLMPWVGNDVAGAWMCRIAIFTGGTEAIGHYWSVFPDTTPADFLEPTATNCGSVGAAARSEFQRDVEWIAAEKSIVQLIMARLGRNRYCRRN